MSRKILYTLTLLVAWALTACDVHQWPEQGVEEPRPDHGTVIVPLRLVYQPDMYLWEHHYDPVVGRVQEDDPTLDIYPEAPGTSLRYSNVRPYGILLTHVKAYYNNTVAVEKTFAREIDGISYDQDIDIELPAGRTYSLVVWSHLTETSEHSPFYDTSDFNRVALYSENYIGNSDYRDGFRGRVSAEIPAIEGDEETRRSDDVITVDMRRPMGKFELLTTDLSEFLDRETARRNLPSRARADEYRVVISFPMYYPYSYSAVDDRLENSSNGYRFTTEMTVTGESEASLGFEYVFQNNISDGAVQAQINVFFLDGTQVAGSASITIPMRRDHHTLLRGTFLSNDNSGGVGLDPSYDGDHNVFW